MKKLLSLQLVLMIVLCAFIFTGCEKTTVHNDYTEEDQSVKPQIGMCFDSFVIERWQRDRDVFVSMAKELGADVNVQNANGDVEVQKEQIDYFIKKGMDVIVIICIDSDALTESVKKAKDAGIKVIAYDRLINNADIDLYISFDNEKVGQIMAEELMNNAVEVNNVVMIGGSPKDNNVSLVEGAFEKAMWENEVKILAQTHCGGWKAELAADFIAENSAIIEHADAIMCGNDDIASQVVMTLAERRLAGKILVTGQDAELAACQRIVEGTQLMTVYKPVENLATQAAKYAVDFATGKDLEGEEIGIISNGNYNVPYVGLDPICVNKDNMEEVIVNSGFHQKEEVYLNVNK